MLIGAPARPGGSSPRWTARGLVCTGGLLWIALCGPGCAADGHRPEPYRSHPGLAEALERRAAEACSGHPDGLPARPFRTDGCSRWPDGSWLDCCVEHDIAYWCGGTRDERRRADAALRECVSETSSLGLAMYVGVRVGGHPWWPARFRWGYGRRWPSGYACREERTGSRAGRPERELREGVRAEAPGPVGEAGARRRDPPGP